MIRPLTCPICHKALVETDAAQRRPLPFCSERCRQIDLLRWCDGRYTIVEPLTPDAFMEDLPDEDQL